MKKKLLLLNTTLLCLIISGCKNDDETIENTPQNQKPGDFTVQVSQITDKNALLNWDKAIDPDEDTITYTIFLNDNEVQSNLETTEFLLETLTAETNYDGKIVASDSHENTSESIFNFTTEKGEILNKELSIAWEKSFGGSHIDIAKSLQLTSDGGYVIVGESGSDDGDVGANNDADGYLGGDIWVIKLNGSGDLQWETNLGGSLDEEGNTIQQTTDGGYIVAGASNSNDQDIGGTTSNFDLWVVKLDTSGNLEWEKNYGGGGNEGANSVKQTTDGGYIAAGLTSSSDGDVGDNNGELDYWVVKLSASGSLEWETNLGGSEADIAKSVEQTSDGGYIIGGYSESSDSDVGGNYGDKDYWVVKLDATGSLIWEKNLGGTLEDYANDILQTTDQGYIVAGFSRSSDFDVNDNNGKKDIWIVKLDTLGEIVWETNLGSSESDSAQSIQQTTDQGYVIAGNSGASDFDASTNNGGYSDFWVVKLNALGELSWEKSFGGPEPDAANAIQQTNNGYIVTGYVRGPGGDISGTGKGLWDYWVVKLE